MKALFQEFWQEEDGLQTVEMVLILIVTVGLVVVFRNAAIGWVSQIIQTVEESVGEMGTVPDVDPIP